MKRMMFLTLVAVLALSLAACGSPQAQTNPEGTEPALVVSGGDVSKSYTRADLESLPAAEATFNDVTYKGVKVSDLLADAGFDLGTIKAVKAVASDGYSVNYDTNQVLVDDVLVAYATASGDLTEDDGAFRMVLPGAEGKLNLRMMVELQVVQ